MKIARLLALVLLAACCPSCSNPDTPASYVGYVTRGAIFGSTTFYGVQRGPTSTGIGWLLDVVNVSVTPYTYTEPFVDETSVLAKDNLKIAFQSHITFRINADRVQEFVEKYATIRKGASSDSVVKDAYDNFLKEPFRTASRELVTAYAGLDIKDNIDKIGADLDARVKTLTFNTPFEVLSVVVGNIQYPASVTEAVSAKLAATQDRERMDTMVEIEKKKADVRVAEATGIAEAMRIVKAQLTPQYLQHEAIEAQKQMVGGPNHTTIYIPVGPMGVPMVATIPADAETAKP